MSVAGRRALVTGASSGIGAATARLLATQGYRLALVARRRERLEALVGELDGPGRHLALPCDVADAGSLEASFARAGEELGGLDLLVNNAGMGYRARIEDLEATTLERVLATNVAAVLLGCRAALPWLRRGTRPVVVNVASVLGRRGFPTQAAYAATKAAVCSIGESLRLEWAAEGIAVCTLNPGRTRSEMLETQPNPAGLPPPDMTRAMSAEQVARFVLALDRRPRPELYLTRGWRTLALLSVLAPRLADRLLARRAGL